MRHVVVIALLAACRSLAQSPAPSFEVASIHPNLGTDRQEIQVTPGALVLRNQPVLFLVQWAYDVPIPQIDYPAWFMANRFDIVAKAAGPTDETQLRLMLQTLLADRFGLKLHKEPRVMPVYALTLAKGGPKFQESPTEGTFALDQTGAFMLAAHHARMSDLAQGISAEAGRPVVDETGLKGRYEIRMDLAAYATRTANGSTNPGQFDMMSILFNGLQDLLGLKLESRKQSVDVLVIDHAEKSPTEN
jgi:uncharacterized protein (TIGR03435 family)